MKKELILSEKYTGYVITDTGIIIGKRGWELKGSFDKDGYRRVNIRTDKGNTLFVHRLVALTFVPNPLGLPQVNHKDSDKSNNSATNLEWCTDSENIVHAIKSGTHNIKGERNHFATFTNEQVLAIRDKGKYASYQKIANDNNTSVNAIVGILKNITWKHI